MQCGFSLSRLAVFWQFCLTCLRERKGEWHTSFLLVGEWSMRVFKRQKARSDACITFFLEKRGVETSFSCCCWVYFQSWCNSRSRICLSRTSGQTVVQQIQRSSCLHMLPSSPHPNTIQIQLSFGLCSPHVFAVGKPGITTACSAALTCSQGMIEMEASSSCVSTQTLPHGVSPGRWVAPRRMSWGLRK